MAQDPYKYFRIEAHELVVDLAKGLGELETHADAALIAKLLRFAHTLKGAARIVRHRELADLAHAMETALGPLRENPVPQRLDDALAIVDRMTAHVAQLSAPAEPVAAAALKPRPAVDAPPLRHDTGAVDEALGGLAAVHALVGRLRTTSDPEAMTHQLDQVDRELREVRRDVEKLRLSATGSLYTALERTARDAATAGGKRVRFALEGGDVRIDAQVVGVIHGALIQLVRNAVVHGIETPADRSGAGKSAEGHVAITARALGRRIAITCEDDGRGLDVEAIRRAAQRRGARVEGADAAQLFQLLLRGGISTSLEITELSGRGIGLDVVRDAAETLGGEVTVQTRAGGGTAIALVVPVSVTAIAVLEVEIGDRIVAIPQAAVRRVARIGANDLVNTAEGVAIVFDDVTVPCASLVGLFGGRVAHGRSAIFLDGGDGVVAVTVDRVLGVEDMIVRAVPSSAPIDAIVLGMALDADGHPYPVVEPRALAAVVRGAQRQPEVAVPKLAPILIVDDSLTTRMLEQSILESAGFEVETAVSAEDALVKLARTTYALMLVDVEMPGMDGFQLIAELRTRPSLASLPAILVTSRDAAADRQRGAAVGAQGYVIKGQFHQGELLAMIHRLVKP